MSNLSTIFRAETLRRSIHENEDMTTFQKLGYADFGELVLVLH